MEPFIFSNRWDGDLSGWPNVHSDGWMTQVPHHERHPQMDQAPLPDDLADLLLLVARALTLARVRADVVVTSEEHPHGFDVWTQDGTTYMSIIGAVLWYRAGPAHDTPIMLTTGNPRGKRLNSILTGDILSSSYWENPAHFITQLTTIAEKLKNDATDAA